MTTLRASNSSALGASSLFHKCSLDLYDLSPCGQKTSMSNLNWQSSDGVTLKSLRQSAGIGLSVLARKASLSVEQLRQLEDGGSNLFYSEAIKLRAGERVLSILGFRFTEPQTQVHEQMPGNPKHRIIPLKPPVPSLLNRLRTAFSFLINELSKFLKTLSERLTAVFNQPFLHRVLHVRKASSLGALTAKPLDISFWHSTGLWVLMGTLASALLVYDFYLNSTQTGSNYGSELVTWVQGHWINTRDEAIKSGINSPVGATSNAVNSSPSKEGGAATLAQADVVEGGGNLPLNTNANSNNAIAVESNNSACHWVSGAPSLSALHPSKQGNFVHIMAITQSNLCVMDAQNKVSMLSMAQGASQSVYGVAPFKVYSDNLKQLKFYFQGYGIYMPVEVEHQFTLTELPVNKGEGLAAGVN